ncbi:MAG: DUF3991 and TOPRIM domain-containing protein [Clostridiales bacterium]|nr:DUF3991 and TOPRIM domain-containing protein [Clostridiales bacterium]
MPYIPFTDEQKIMANSVDLEYFLRSRGEKLEKVGREHKLIYSDGSGRHDSITMSGSTWFDHKNQTGGGAIKFMQYFYGMSFTEAVQNLLGYTVTPFARNTPDTAPEPKKEFTLPPKNKTMNRVYAYLIKQRYIAPEVVSYFAKEGKIYEDSEYHNAVFVGLDENGIPRQAHKRSTNSYGNSFRITVEGSDTDYSFAHYGTSGRLYVFEAPIDMLSYITLHPEIWQKHSYIAMNGVYESAVLKALELHDNIEHIVICTDNDEGGIDAYDRLSDILNEHGYTNVTRIYPTYKDFNEDLKALNGQSAIIAVPHEKKRIYHNSVDALNYYPCRPDKLSSQLRAAYKNGQYRYLAEYALAGSAYFMRVKDENKVHSFLKAKLRKEYRAYKDKARLDVKYRDLTSKLKEVLTDLKQPARTYEQSIATAKKLYELADCAVKVQTQEEINNQQTDEMTENEEQDEEAELSPLPSLS